MLPSRISPVDLVRAVGEWVLADVRERVELRHRQAVPRAHQSFRARLEQAMSRTQRNDFDVLRRLESVLRPERREHFFVVGFRERALFIFHAAGTADDVAFGQDALIDWLDEIDPEDAFAVHSHLLQRRHPPVPSHPDRRMTRALFELEPIREHYIVLPSENDTRFTIYSFTQRSTKVLECIEERRELRAAGRRR